MPGLGGGVGHTRQMANSYLPVGRDEVFLLPPDMRDWLTEGHLVWFVLDVLERVDATVLHDRRRLGGVGRRGYDPEMLLALLVYAYCTGQRSSRQIERFCEVDVAYRVICGGNRPDHTTIARFRQDHEDHAVQLFTDALVICAEAGLATVGVVAVDGTKMGTDASWKANRTRESIEAEVRRMLKEASDVDAEQDRLFGEDRGDELPAELRDRSSRGRRLDAALEAISQREAQQQRERSSVEARAEAVRAAAAQGRGLRGRPPKGANPVAEAEARLERARHKAARRAEVEAKHAAAGTRPRGRRPKTDPKAAVHTAEEALEQARARGVPASSGTADDDQPVQANITDPDSRSMKTPNGWVQGYNAQAAVNEHGVVVAVDVTQDHNDVKQLVPMIAAIRHSLNAAGISAEVGVLLLDAGYWSEDNATAKGPDRLIATTKDWKRRKQLREQDTVVGLPPEDATPKEAMEHRLCTAEGAELYAKRGHTVEPVFGDHKHNRGFRRFVRRGLTAARAEWLLITATGNLLKAYRCHHAQTTA